MSRKIYFAGSIRGGRDDAELYAEIIDLLSQFGQVLTEHVGSNELLETGEETLSDEEIFERDMAWLTEADVVVAEVTLPSHGVGYEIGRARAMGKPILCLYRRATGHRLSAMLAGDPNLLCEAYAQVAELEPLFTAYFRELVC